MYGKEGQANISFSFGKKCDHSQSEHSRGKSTPGGLRAWLRDGGGMVREGRTSIESVNSGLGLEDSGEPWTAGGGTDAGIHRMESIFPEEGVIRW